MTRLWALLATAGCLYFALHSVAAGIARPDYFLFLVGLLWICLSGIALHFVTGKVRA